MLILNKLIIFNKLHKKRGGVFGRNKEFLKNTKKFFKKVWTKEVLCGKLWEIVNGAGDFLSICPKKEKIFEKYKVRSVGFAKIKR